MHDDAGGQVPDDAGTTADDGVDAAARDNLARVLEAGVDPAAIDPDVDLAEGYGLTSLNKILFLMSLCEETGAPLAAFTEADVAAMHTLRDVVDALAPHVPAEA